MRARFGSWLRWMNEMKSSQPVKSVSQPASELSGKVASVGWGGARCWTMRCPVGWNNSTVGWWWDGGMVGWDLNWNWNLC